MIREIQKAAPSGWMVLFVLFAVLAGLITGLVFAVLNENIPGTIVSVVGMLITLFLFFGLFLVNPNEAKVLQLFGKYMGTVHEPGLRWANPFYMKRRVSRRVRNFETGKLKVNDNRGNPIEIAAVVVWKVVDTAEAVFEVDDYVNYVHVQSEAAARALATQYPYDAHEEGQSSLVGNTTEISAKLKVENQERLDKAGIEIIETRISHLAYSPEIANAMLRRQQASAVIAARQKIVEGAVGMVKTALELLSQHEVVELDEDRKATMVSNLLVVLCSETSTQPVVNAGTLYA
jgi:regulator of protease activity HflC (stomatin/prohibitin superfamily)